MLVMLAGLSLESFRVNSQFRQLLGQHIPSKLWLTRLPPSCPPIPSPVILEGSIKSPDACLDTCGLGDSLAWETNTYYRACQGEISGVSILYSAGRFLQIHVAHFYTAVLGTQQDFGGLGQQDALQSNRSSLRSCKTITSQRPRLKLKLCSYSCITYF